MRRPGRSQTSESSRRPKRRPSSAGRPAVRPKAIPTDLKPAPTFAQGWRIGTPDAIFEMQEDYPVPARGTIQYQHFYIPTNFTEAKWLKAIEARPGNRALVHHILVFYEAPPDGPRVPPAIQPNREDSQIPKRRARAGQSATARYRDAHTSPGHVRAGNRRAGLPSRHRAATGAGRYSPLAGALHRQRHGRHRSQQGGLIFAKEPPAEEIRPAQFINGRFTIPPGAADHQVSTDVTFLQDATLRGIFPHTHVRGKRWSYTLELPDGTKRPLLSVPKYDFNWQTYYMFREPIAVPKGARIVSTAWYDNSAANKSNPDPTIAVTWGDQTWEEMQYTGILFSVKR